jgi:hypothetical protein
VTLEVDAAVPDPAAAAESCGETADEEMVRQAGRVTTLRMEHRRDLPGQAAVFHLSVFVAVPVADHGRERMGQEPAVPEPLSRDPVGLIHGDYLLSRER